MIDRSGTWTDVVFLDGDEFYDAYDARSIDELAEYLSQWDNGEDYDTREGAGWGTLDSVREVNVNGLDYVIAVNWPLGYASLSRRPIGYDELYDNGEGVLVA